MYIKRYKNMDNFKGTKGNWKVNGLSKSGNPHFNVIGTVLGGRFKVARVPFIFDEKLTVRFNQLERNEAEANAYLIAAAPRNVY